MFLGKINEWSESKQGFYFILFISAILKALILWALSDTPINRDGVLYISAAQEFAAGHFKESMAIYPMPLYPALIAIVHWIIPHWVMAARLISYTTLVLVVIPLYYLINHLFGRCAAFWGCLAFVLAPVPNGWVVKVIRGPSFVFVLTWAVFFASRAILSLKRTDFLLAAFFAWISTLLRIEGLTFIFYYLFFLGILAIWRVNERRFFLSGVILWIAIPLSVISIAFVAVGSEGMLSFNRASAIISEAQGLLQFRFLDNYHMIYQQLKTLENTLPFNGLGHYNVVAIFRHYMLVIYLFGIIEGLVKILFPFFVIPLFWGFRSSLQRVRVFVLLFVVVYLIVVYYYSIKVGFVRSRFLFTPAFLLYPWIGEGLKQMFAFLRRTSNPKFFAAVFVGLFIMLPLCKVGLSFVKHDTVIIKTGEWLAMQTKLKEAKIATNESKILFYACKENWADQIENYRPYARLNYDYKKIEQLAQEREMDILIIRTTVKRKKEMAKLEYFKKVMEFTDKKDVAIIYCSPKFIKNGPELKVKDKDNVLAPN